VTSYRDLLTGLRALQIDPTRPVIVHTSLSAFGQVNGGAESILGALRETFQSLMVPTFTYKTMVIPEVGPPENGIRYGSGRDSNRMAEIYHMDMPSDHLMGVLPELLRCQPDARRSAHPILSFSAIRCDLALNAQMLNDPLAPIRALMDAAGWVVLMGVDHTANTSIHLGERLAGRRQFLRWALTRRGVLACPGFPGCSDGFQDLEPVVDPFVRRVPVGPTQITAVPLIELVQAIRELLLRDPLALLCCRPVCERCDAVRASLNHGTAALGGG
jgi:aminoglycoside 3-N-acetyltransferase